MSTTIKDLIESPHVVYKTYIDYWSFLLQSYEGGIDYCRAGINSSTDSNSLKNWALKIFAGGREVRSTKSGNLFMHPKERWVDYAERLSMSYYFNFCSPIIDIYTDHLFKQKVKEDFKSIDAEVNERYENIDNKGGSVGEFRKELADLAQVYGHMFVVTDSPRFKGEVKTKADVIDNGLLPYFTLHHPQNVINWALDEFGSPYWVVVREVLDGNPDPMAYNKEEVEKVQFRLWTRQNWTLYNEKYEQIDIGLHRIGRVPLTCVYDKASKKVRSFLGISSIADIAFIARDVYNSCSELKQILRDQTFAFLAIQGNASEYDEASVGTSKGLMYPPDRNMPQYISPPPANAEVYFKHIDRQVSKMFQLAKLEGGSAEFGGQTAVEQSGVSKAWDFNQTNSALSKKASNIEDGETKLWQDYAAWLDKEFDGSVEYPHEFSVNSLNEDLDEAEKMMRMQLGAEVNKEVKAAIIQKKFPRMDKETVDGMIEKMKAQEDTAARGESGNLLNKIPSLMKMSALNNAYTGGKNGG